MKRLFVVILLLTYFLSTTGADVHLHYCMGKLAGWSVWSHDDKKECDKCGMEKNALPGKGCCSDDQKWLKVDNDQKLSFYAFALAKAEPAENKTQPAYDFSILALESQVAIPQSHAPPLISSNQLYLLHNNFRI